MPKSQLFGVCISGMHHGVLEGFRMNCKPNFSNNGNNKVCVFAILIFSYKMNSNFGSTWNSRNLFTIVIPYFENHVIFWV